MHHVTDVVLGPGEDSSTGNVTGGRKFARYVLVFDAMFAGFCART
jgi:hypothetical protein